MQIISKKKIIGYFKEKAIYFFKYRIYYSIKKDLYKKTYILGFSTNTAEKKYFSPFIEDLKPYNCIYIIDSNLGEAFLTLRLLPNIINTQDNKNHLLIVTQNYHVQLINLLKIEIPYRLIPELHYSIMKSSFRIYGKQFHLLYSHQYYQKIEESLTGNRPIHFFDAILRHLNLSADRLTEKTVQISTEAQESLAKKIKEIELKNNFVILSPEANSCKQIETDFWNDLIQRFQSHGLDVFLNTINNLCLKNVKTCYLNFEEFCLLLQKAKGSVFLRSGLCDIAVSCIESPSVILYTGLNYKENINTLAGFSVLPFSKNKSLIKELVYTTAEENLKYEIIENICSEKNLIKRFIPSKGENMTYYIVSGGFDPIHEGHIAMIRSAVEQSDGVIVLVNSDEWLKRKKGQAFQNFYTRKVICENIKGVICALGFDDSDDSASDGIRKVRQMYPNEHLVFANGGDRGKDNIREDKICEECRIEKVFGVGGTKKSNSSSWILNQWIANNNKNY